MRPEDYPYDHDAVLEIWYQFRQSDNKTTHSIISPHNIDPLVLESWQRCTRMFQDNFHMHHRSRNVKSIEILVEDNKELISVATPYLEEACQLATDAHVVFLTDNEGMLLALQLDHTVSNIYRGLGFSIGEIWTESLVGTNAIALSLQSAMVTQVIGAEHYLQIYHEYGNTAAPIHGTEGEIIGTIGMFTSASSTNGSHLALIMTTARAITNQIQSDAILDQANQRLKQLDSIIESVADGVITWDKYGRIAHINSTACKILGVKRASLLGRNVASILELAPHLQTAISNQQDLSDIETMLQIGDLIVKCMISLRTIYDQQQIATGGVTMLRPLSQVRNLVNQQTSIATRLTIDDFYAKSSALRKILRQAEIAARASAPVLLYGESGVGKTTLAQAIHGASPRNKKPLIIVNCSAIPHDMVLSELLGVEAQGSENGRPSKFELADGGTILIDQIDQLSLQGQAILQDVIDTRHLMRLNSKRATPINVRIIATTDVDIDKHVESGAFARQLYFRFSVFKLFLPPLRDRTDDIEVLAKRFMQRSTEYCEIEDDALELLYRYPWPGNVRELESVIERAILHSEDGIIHLIDLPENVRTVRSLEPDRVTTDSVLTLQEAERETIIRAGWACQGGVSAMADVLGINRSTLWRKLKQYSINTDNFKR